jgi:hypothetical protein
MNPIIKHLQETIQPPNPLEWVHIKPTNSLHLYKNPETLSDPLITITPHTQTIVLLALNTYKHQYDLADPKSLTNLTNYIQTIIKYNR